MVRSRLVRGFLPLLVIACAPMGAAEPPGGWFPFVMSPLDNPGASPVDMSYLNGGPATRRILAKDGRFVDEAGERVRFLGVNITFAGCFPEREAATKIARRLAQLGFNVVRFHHMDARDIWLPDQSALDPEKLDRLDWFLHQLKENGVYANLNLHVSRTYPGLKEANLPYGYRYGKMVDRFYEPFVVLQEEFASALLDRVNPHTKLRVADDPAVAFVEMNNENTLLAMRGEAIAGLSGPYRAALEAKWREWLKGRYPAAASLREAWVAGAEAPGAEMLKNGGFASGLEGWSPQGPKKDVCTLAVGEGPDGGRAAVFGVLKAPAQSYGNQLHQVGLNFEEGRTYTLRFQGRADPPREISAYLSFADGPWTAVAERHSVRLDKRWAEKVVIFKVRGVDPAHRTRLSLGLGATTGEVAFAAVSLRPGRPEFRLPDGGIDAMGLVEAHWPPRAVADFREALVDIERATVGRIARHIREKIGLKSLLCDTQASYGGCWGLRRELEVSDYIDMHAYWQHPRFPGKPWDSNNWNIPNTSMVADPQGGTFGRLALYRGAGRAYSVSEYNHPAPNDQAAELFLMLGAFAAAQDWDAVYQFSYLNSGNAGNGKINGYFELAHHPAQLVFAPIASVMFRQGGVGPLPETLAVAFPLEGMRDHLESDWITADKWVAASGATPGAILSRRTASRIVENGAGPMLEPPASTPADGHLIHSPQLRWNPSGEHPDFVVNAPSVRAAVGVIGGRRLDLGDVAFDIQLPAKTWACAAIAALDGKPIAESSRMLLALATRAENSGMAWDAGRTTLGRNWGDAPVIAQGVPAAIRLPGAGQPTVAALDPRGERVASIPVKRATGGWDLTVGPDHRTLWYAIERPAAKK